MRSLLAIAFLFFACAGIPCAGQVQVKLDHPIRHVAGLVQKPNGDPAPNIDVEVFGGRSLIANSKTDSHGKFSTDGLEPGEYEVWFTYKPHPVFKDVIYKITISPKGSKEPIVVKLQALQE